MQEKEKINSKFINKKSLIHLILGFILGLYLIIIYNSISFIIFGILFIPTIEIIFHKLICRKLKEHPIYIMNILLASLGYLISIIYYNIAV